MRNVSFQQLFLGLKQRNYLDSSSSLLDFVLSNFADLLIDLFEYCIVKISRFNHPFIVKYTMPIRRSNHNFNFSFK
jgi:hypothetical protein